MNELSIKFIGVILVGTIACLWDLRLRKIPNWLTFSAMCLGLILSWSLDQKDWMLPLLGIVGGFLLLLLPYLLGGIGAGDVKLLMAFGAFLGIVEVSQIFFYGAIWGGFCSLLTLLKALGYQKAWLRLQLLTSSLWSNQSRQLLKAEPRETKLFLPYGVPLFLGLLTFVGIALRR